MVSLPETSEYNNLNRYSNDYSNQKTIVFPLDEICLAQTVYYGSNPVVRHTETAVTLNSEMDFYLRNGRNGDFRYEMELQNSILFIIGL